MSLEIKIGLSSEGRPLLVATPELNCLRFSCYSRFEVDVGTPVYCNRGLKSLVL